MCGSLIHIPILLVLASVQGTLGQDPVVTQLIDPVSLSSDGTTLTMVFDDLQEEATMNFEAQYSDNVTAWTGIPTGTISPMLRSLTDTPLRQETPVVIASSIASSLTLPRQKMAMAMAIVFQMPSKER